MIMSRLLKLPQLAILTAQLRAHGVEYGKKVRGNKIVLKNRGRIIVGIGVTLNSFPEGQPNRTVLQTHCSDAVLSVGDYCILNGVTIHCRTRVEIGKFCLFGPGAALIDNDSHRTSTNVAERRKPPRSAPIILGDNVWIGMNSLVLKGVEIGKNAIVAAHAVVTKDVPENALVAGNPARVVKSLEP